MSRITLLFGASLRTSAVGNLCVGDLSYDRSHQATGGNPLRTARMPFSQERLAR